MPTLHRRPALLVAGLVLAGTLAGGAVPAGAAAAPSCGFRWGSLPRTGGALQPAPLLSTRTGRHDCYDRLVFELRGGADGYRVNYAPEVYTEGEGAPLSPVTAGGALLRVALLEPAYDPETGAVTYPHRVGDHVAAVAGYDTLRDVVFGGSFEGYSTFAVGVRARLPFRVVVLPGPGSHSRIVVDVAHRW
jgi:hypothetical protein